MAGFAVLGGGGRGGLLIAPIVTMGSFWPGVGPFRALGEAGGLCPGSGGRRRRTAPAGGYPARGVQ